MAATPDSVFAWTAAELQARYGNLPLERLFIKPNGLSATANDVTELYAAGQGMFELDRGLLIRKPSDPLANVLCARLARHIGSHLKAIWQGMVLGSMAAGVADIPRILLPDLCYFRECKSNVEYANSIFASVIPDLVVEIIRPGNTGEEMELKLQEYFSTGVRLVWYAYPRIEEVHAYENLEQVSIHTAAHTLTGGEVLPGLALPMAELFADLQA